MNQDEVHWLHPGALGGSLGPRVTVQWPWLLIYLGPVWAVLITKSPSATPQPRTGSCSPENDRNFCIWTPLPELQIISGLPVCNGGDAGHPHFLWALNDDRTEAPLAAPLELPPTWWSSPSASRRVLGSEPFSAPCQGSFTQGNRAEETGCGRDSANWSKRFCRLEIVALGKLRCKEPCDILRAWLQPALPNPAPTHTLGSQDWILTEARQKKKSSKWLN